MLGDDHEPHPVGFLSVLRGLGRRGHARFPLLPISDTNDIASVSPFWLFTIPLSLTYVCTA